MKQEYRPALSLYETQSAIGAVKRIFQEQLARRLGLLRSPAPLFVDPATGLNDDLSGVERPVAFDIPQIRSLSGGGGNRAEPGKMEAPGAGAVWDLPARDFIPI